MILRFAITVNKPSDLDQSVLFLIDVRAGHSQNRSELRLDINFAQADNTLTAHALPY